jgi:hypothetical protein
VRRIAVFEKIAAAAGVELDDPQAASEVPPSLLAAASDPRRTGASVRLDVDGREMVAVVGGERGDPREWWAAIQRLSARQQNAS